MSVNLSKQDRRSSLPDLLVKVEDSLEINISAETEGRRLRKAGLMSSGYT